MNEIFSRLGEFNDVLHYNENGKASNYKVSDKSAPRRKCLAACQNQVRLESFLKSDKFPKSTWVTLDIDNQIERFFERTFFRGAFSGLSV